MSRRRKARPRPERRAAPRAKPPVIDHHANRLTVLRRFALLDEYGRFQRCRSAGCAGKLIFPDEEMARAAITAMRAIESGENPVRVQRVFRCDWGRGYHVTSKREWLEKPPRRRRSARRTLPDEDAGQAG